MEFDFTCEEIRYGKMNGLAVGLVRRYP